MVQAGFGGQSEARQNAAKGPQDPSLMQSEAPEKVLGLERAPELAPGVPLSRDLQELKESLHHAAHLLPAQGPINVFIHHNTLHAFEELPFDEAVQAGGRLLGCQPYLS